MGAGIGAEIGAVFDAAVELNDSANHDSITAKRDHDFKSWQFYISAFIHNHGIVMSDIIAGRSLPAAGLHP
jgi:hypothetical protein